MIYHHDVTNSEVSEIQTWALYSRKIITFQNKANLNLFLEIFKEDAETGLRREDKWVWSGPIVRTEILSLIIILISAYDAGLSAAINGTLAILNNETKLEKLQYFDLHHVKIILRELQKQIENMPIFKDNMVQFRTMLKEYKITPPTVHRLEDGTEEFKEA